MWLSPFMREEGRRGSFTTGRDALIAGSTLALGSILLLGGAYSRRSGALTSPTWLFVPLTVVCASLLLRRTHPLLGLGLCLAGVIGDTLLGPSALPIIVLTDLLYNVSLRGSRKVLPWLTGGGIIAVTLFTAVMLMTANAMRNVLLAAVYATIVLIWPMTTGLTVRRAVDQANAESWRVTEVLVGAAREKQESMAMERARLASDIHDIVSGHLSAIALQSTAALSLTQRDSNKYLSALKLIRENSLAGVDAVRHMVTALRGHTPAGSPPSLAGVEQLVDRMGRMGMAVQVHTTGSPALLRPAVEIAAYHIIQEALTNALKHAHGAEISILIEHMDERIAITVENTLTPTGATRLPDGNGFGLISMRQRAERVGGTCTAHPEEGRWRVRAVFPTLAPHPLNSHSHQVYDVFEEGSVNGHSSPDSG